MKTDTSLGSKNDPRHIPAWTRRYAQNRGIPVALAVGVFSLISLSLAGLSTLAGQSYRGGNVPVLLLSSVGLVLTLGALVWMAIPAWGGRWLQAVGLRAYQAEGDVTVAANGVSGSRLKGVILLGTMFTGVLATVILQMVGLLDDQYAMPFSALYVVPFLVLITHWLRPATSVIFYLWPALYAIHAALILLGVPLSFTGQAAVLNFLMPMAGYCLLTVFISHLYSRLALARLKTLSNTGGAGMESNDG